MALVGNYVFSGAAKSFPLIFGTALLLGYKALLMCCNRSNFLIVVAEALPGHSASEKDTNPLVLPIPN